MRAYEPFCAFFVTRYNATDIIAFPHDGSYTSMNQDMCIHDSEGPGSR